MEKNCKKCSVEFVITDEDQNYYKKIAVPLPTFCPLCRHQRRLLMRNERCLYKRKCDMCSKSVFSLYDADSPYTVYCISCWWSDKWNPLDYGRDFDFSMPFFEQFKELMLDVPKASALQLQNENSEYNSFLAYSKNTYMSPGSYCCEDCYFLRKSQFCSDSMYSCLLDKCTLTAFSTNCSDCYSCHHLIDCRNCNDCSFVADSTGCKNCFMCVGLSQAQYHYKNKQYSKEECEEILERKMKEDASALMTEFKEFLKTVPRKCLNNISCENCRGDYLHNSKNAQECYDCFDLEDCKYIYDSADLKDSMDCSMHDKEIELAYECCSGGEKNVNLKFSFCTVASPNSEYLYSCFSLNDSFGCEGFHLRQSNCILNKKYSQEEYKVLKAKIVEHMKSTGEYGEFFPASLSPFAYNESSAQIFLPLTKEEAIAQGFRWKDVDKSEYQKSPDYFNCEDCGKNFKVMPQEEKIYDRLKISFSKKCAECIYSELFSMKNPRKLCERKCDKCGKDIESTYAPDKSEIVYCEKCYLEEIK